MRDPSSCLTGALWGAVKVGDGHSSDLIALLGHQLILHAAVRPDKEDPAAWVLLLKDVGQRHRRGDYTEHFPADTGPQKGLTGRGHKTIRVPLCPSDVNSDGAG